MTGSSKPGFAGDVVEPAGAVVLQKRGPDRASRSHAPAGNEDVEPAVVVVVGLIADEPAELIGDSRALAAIFKFAVAAVPIERHRLGGVVAGDDDVEEPVAVEVVHDRAAGLVEPVEPGFVALVAERADVEFGVEEIDRSRGETAGRPHSDDSPSVM